MIKEDLRTKIVHFVSMTSLGIGLILVTLLGIGLIRPPHLPSVSVAHAAGTIAVNTTADEHDITPNSTCSLREAIESINTGSSFGGCNNPGNVADTIQLLATTYTLTIPDGLPFDNSVGSLELTTNTTIQGMGAGQTVITTTTGFNDGVIQTFSAVPSSTITIEGLTIQGGRGNRGSGIEMVLSDPGSAVILTDVVIKDNQASSSGGAGIYIQGDAASTITLDRVVLENNQGTGSPSGGGGLACSADSATSVTVNLNEVMLRNNQLTAADSYGGGLLLVGCNANLTNVSLIDNQAGNLGGGIFATDYYGNSASLQMTNVTIYSNTAQISGGGLYLNYDSLPGSNLAATLTNVTLANNQAVSGSGGNIFNNQATLSLKNTLVANGLANGSSNNCAGNPVANLTSQGSNLDSGNTCSLSGSGDITNTNPLLAGALADNGGSTPTLALLSGSPAIDAGDNVGCPAIDQRGIPRPQGAQCDIGAYEFALPLLILTKTVDDPTPAAGQAITYTIRVENSGPLSATDALISDLLPPGLTPTGSITLDPPGAGTIGTPPALVSNLTLTPGQRITVTLPVQVSANLTDDLILTNTAAITSAEVITPQTGSVAITIGGDVKNIYLPLILKN